MHMLSPSFGGAWLHPTQPSAMPVPLMPLGHARPLRGFSRMHHAEMEAAPYFTGNGYSWAYCTA